MREAQLRSYPSLAGMPNNANNCEWECEGAYSKVLVNGVDTCVPGQGVQLTALKELESAAVRSGDVRVCGRVEVYDYGSEQWGTVCDDFWEDVDAQVVCAQLGCAGGGSAVQGFGGGSGPIWMDDVKCDGSEASLTRCTSAAWGVHNCQHSEDAGACCVGLDWHTAACSTFS